MRNDSLLVSNVLNELRLIIALAEEGGIGTVKTVEVDFVVEVEKKSGASAPMMWILPKDLFHLEAKETTKQRLKFTLNRIDPSGSNTSFRDELYDAMATIKDSLNALRLLKDQFETEVKIGFDLNFSQAGGNQLYFHGWRE